MMSHQTSRPANPGAAPKERTTLSLFTPGQSESFRKVNQQPFPFSHELGEHPLFELDRLASLSDYLRDQVGEDRVAMFNDDAALTQGWQRQRREGADVRECLETIHESHSWVLLKDIQRHADYKFMIGGFLAELEHLTGQSLRDDITWIDAYVFVSSPGMVTPYHIDHESNFLFQIRGEKQVHVCDPADRKILSESEIERYYVGDFNAAKFNDRAQERAERYTLTPGQGIHQPPLAPHWVQTGSEASVTLSLLFFLRPYDLRAKVYQTNFLLRKLGMHPLAPGQSKFRDSLKRWPMTNLGYQPRLKQEILRTGVRKFRHPLRFLDQWLRQRLAKTAQGPRAHGWDFEL